MTNIQLLALVSGVFLAFSAVKRIRFWRDRRQAESLLRLVTVRRWDGQ